MCSLIRHLPSNGHKPGRVPGLRDRDRLRVSPVLLYMPVEQRSSFGALFPKPWTLAHRKPSRNRHWLEIQPGGRVEGKTVGGWMETYANINGMTASVGGTDRSAGKGRFELKDQESL